MTKQTQQKITAALFLELAAEGELVPIFPAGISMGHDGRGPYIMLNPAAVIAASKRAMVDLVIDRDHATDLLPLGHERRAAGWIKELVEVDGAVFAKVDWTKRGSEDLRDKEYRYISPTFDFDVNTREVLRIRRATLTNSPNFDMKAVASEGAEDVDLNQPESDQEETPTMDKYKTSLIAIAAVMALAATATPEDIEKSVIERLKEIDTVKAELASVRAALKLDDKADAQTVVATATAAVASSQPDPAKFVPMEAHKAVVDKLAAVQKDTAGEKVAEAVDAAMKAGKLAPSQKEWATAYASSDLAAFEAYVAAAPVIVTASEQLKGKPATTTQALDQTQSEICAQLGLTPEDFKKAEIATAA